jgi:hypothetical protein
VSGGAIRLLTTHLFSLLARVGCSGSDLHTLHTLAHPSGRGCAKGRPAPIGLKVRLHYVSARSEEVASGRGRLAHLAHLSGRTHPGGAPAGQQPTHSQPGSCVVCVGGLSTYTTFLYISRGKGCARCARPGSTFADRPETQRNRSLRRFGADHSFAHPSGQGVCKGVQGCANGCSTHRWWRACELLRRPCGIDAARRAASIGGTQNRQPGSLTWRSGASTRNRMRDSLRVLGGPTGPILGRGVQGCARVCKGVQGVQLHSMASTIIAEQCKMRAIGFRVDWACHRPDWACSIRSI